MSLLKSVFAALLFALTAASYAADAPDVININTADAKALEALNGVGPAKAAAIVAHREANGPFAAIEELADVQGIGMRTVELNRASMTVDSTPDATAAAEKSTAGID